MMSSAALARSGNSAASVVFPAWQTALQYAHDIVSGRKKACYTLKKTAWRFLSDLKNPKYEIRHEDAEFAIAYIQSCCYHQKGEAIDGTPLLGKLLKLEPWQIFIIYNVLGFYLAGTNERRFKEAFINIPRKNGKTSFIAALGQAIAVLQRRSGSTLHIVSVGQKQSTEIVGKIIFNLERSGDRKKYRVRNNNVEHSIFREYKNDAGEVVGSIDIVGLAGDANMQDGFIGNVQICDEVHTYEDATRYEVIQQAGIAYTNKLCMAITTAGKAKYRYCQDRIEYCVNVLKGIFTDEQLFCYICRADSDPETGLVDFTNPDVLEGCNPNWNVSVRPSEILAAAYKAQNDPNTRADFLAKRCNVYTSAIKSYFDTDAFRRSDALYSWTLADLAALPIKWYGGADLSMMHDLTGACIYGTYDDIDIAIVHNWIPRTQVEKKTERQNIPALGWEQDGILTICNDAVINHEDVVRWFCEMRAMGFDIDSVGYDVRFCQEFFPSMVAAGFTMFDQPQYFDDKSQGFKHIERQMLRKKFYYLHDQAFEYCVGNVFAVLKHDNMVQYAKRDDNAKIDAFDCTVFAAIRKLKAEDERKKKPNPLENYKV